MSAIPYTDVVFQDDADVQFFDYDVIWHRGRIDDAMRGIVLVNPKMSEDIEIFITPLMSAAISVIEYLKAILEVEPYE